MLPQPGQDAVSEVDLSACAKEPIHTPGSVQPHGCLLIVDASGTVVQHSANAAELLLGDPEGDPLNAPLADLVGESAATSVLGGREGEVLRVERGASAGARTIELVAHAGVEGQTLVEVEPAAVADPAATAPQDRLLAELFGGETLDEVVDRAARAFRSFTGYDRVMVYRFDRDMHGRVVAEDKREDLTPYLGLQYPATDIPEQARRLYRRRLLRQIADVEYAPSRLVPELNPRTGEPLDLSDVSIRSVSPVHIEYLRNMGARATLTVSILDEAGELWGLIACHHETPRRLSLASCRASESAANALAFAVRAHDLRERQARVIRASRSTSRLLARIAETPDFARALSDREAELLDIPGASGAAVAIDGRVLRFGDAPPAEDVERVVGWVTPMLAEQPVYATDALPAAVETELLEPHAGSGLLAIRFHEARGGLILWFRPEAVREVRWGGDPRTPARVTPGEKIGPRRSFQEWTEVLRLRSRPWEPADVEAAQALRSALRDVAVRIDSLHAEVEAGRRAERDAQTRAELLRILNADLERACAAAEAAGAGRAQLLASMSHEIRSPMTAILGFAKILDSKNATGPERAAAVATIRRSGEQLMALITDVLDLSRLESGDPVIRAEPADIAELLSDAVDPARVVASTTNTDLTLRIDPSVPSRAVTDPVRLRQIVGNLVNNAVKFTPGGRVNVSAAASQAPEGWRLAVDVEDNGIGIAPEYQSALFTPFSQGDPDVARRFGGTGIGLSIVQRLSRLLGGDVTLVRSAPGEGSTFRARVLLGEIAEAPRPS